MSIYLISVITLWSRSGLGLGWVQRGSQGANFKGKTTVRVMQAHSSLALPRCSPAPLQPCPVAALLFSIPSFSRWGQQGTEKWNNLSKLTQVAWDRIEIWNLTPESTLLLMHHLPLFLNLPFPFLFFNPLLSSAWTIVVIYLAFQPSVELLSYLSALISLE